MGSCRIRSVYRGPALAGVGLFELFPVLVPPLVSTYLASSDKRVATDSVLVFGS